MEQESKTTLSFYLSINALLSLWRRKTYKELLKNNLTYLVCSEEEYKESLDKNGTVDRDSSLLGQILGLEDNDIGRITKERISPEELFRVGDKRSINGDFFSNAPFSVFILDIAPSTARRISRQYGVLCYSDKRVIRLTQLKRQCSFFLSKDERYDDGIKNWCTILKRIKEVPINTILINDRYMACTKYNNKSEIDQNRLSYNLQGIVSELLSNSEFVGKYYIFIYFDAIDNKWAKDWLEIHSKDSSNCQLYQSDVKKEFDRKASTIRSAILSVIGELKDRTEVYCASFLRYIKDNHLASYVKNYDYTHNRRILTNYYHIIFEHDLLAFDSNSKSTVDQGIIIKSLYSEGLNDVSDTPIRRHMYELNALSSLYSKDLMLWHNGKIIEDPERVKQELNEIPILAQIIKNKRQQSDR